MAELGDGWWPCPCCDGDGGSNSGPLRDHSQLEMAVWRYDASRNIPEGREERWLDVLATMGVCRECRHPHSGTCWANVGGASPEPCHCEAVS